MAANWNAVNVFKLCGLTYVGTGMQVICIGITAQEIASVMGSMRIKPNRVPRLLRDVSFMGRCAAEYVNDLNRQAAKRNG